MLFTMSHLQLPEPKRRKTGKDVHVTVDGTEIRPNGTMTPRATQVAFPASGNPHDMDVVHSMSHTVKGYRDVSVTAAGFAFSTEYSSTVGHKSDAPTSATFFGPTANGTCPTASGTCPTANGTYSNSALSDIALFGVPTGTVANTALPSTPSDTMGDDMDTREMSQQCPCGHLHGANSHEPHDISAVGFSTNLMRGPD